MRRFIRGNPGRFAPLQYHQAALGLRPLRTQDNCDGEYSVDELCIIERPLLPMQRIHFAALPSGRAVNCHSPVDIIAWHFGYGFAAFAALGFTWAMIALAFIDIDTQLLPNDITMPLLWTGLLVNLADTFTDIGSAVLGAVAGYIMLWSIYWAFKLVTRREGMGYGDFKLLAAIGAWLGWQMLPLVILFSSIAGTAVGVFLMAVSKRAAP